MKYRHLPPAERRAAFIDRGLQYAAQVGWASMTRDGFARHAGVATGLLGYYWPTWADFRESVMAEAVRRSVLGVVAHGLILGSTAARAAPTDLKQQALAAAVNQ